jgi:hypothetical protein
MPWRRWLKWLILIDTQRQQVLAQGACSGSYNGSAMLHPLVDLRPWTRAAMPASPPLKFWWNLNV